MTKLEIDPCNNVSHPDSVVSLIYRSFIQFFSSGFLLDISKNDQVLSEAKSVHAGRIINGMLSHRFIFILKSSKQIKCRTPHVYCGG